jgi:hypothetical protein
VSTQPLAADYVDIVGGTLGDMPCTPALGAAFYRVLATTPGVVALGPKTDALGRHGEAVASTDRNGIREELLIDPSTGRLLERRLIATHRTWTGLRAGTTLGVDTYVAAGVVSSVHARR